MAKTLGSTNLRVGANIGPLKAALKTASAKLRRFGSTAKKVGGTLSRGLSAPIALIGVSSVKVFADFESEMSKVKAVSGATAEQLKMLTANAKNLGSTTVFTARDVASLQVEFAKLGFTASEIDKVTESTLYLAQASGSDLARAAEVAGATLRGFGLEAEETGRVTDVMALSFASSALDMESFADSMKYVAPVANSVGISIEETTAMLQLLSNANIKGSMAGTAMKKIIGELGSTSDGVAGAIKKLAKEGIQLADAKDEVGERAQAALLVLANGIDTVDGLTDALVNSTGAAKRMGQEMTDNTAGAFKILRSAIEGAQIEIGESITKNQTFKGILEGLTKTLGRITKHITEMTDAEQFNAVALAALTTAIPILILAVGSLTVAFGSLTAAMGPVAIAITGVAIAYALIKKSISETDQVIKDSLLNENTAESIKLIKEQLAVTQYQLKRAKEWAAEQPKNASHRRLVLRLQEEEINLKNALIFIGDKESSKRKGWADAEAEHAREYKERIENEKTLKSAHAATTVELNKKNTAYQVLTTTLEQMAGLKLAPLAHELDSTMDRMDRMIVGTKELNIAVSEAINQMALDTIVGMAEIGGAIMVGEASFRDMGKFVLGQFSSLLKQLGTMMIEYGMAAEGFKAALALGPLGGGLAIAAGIALLAVSGAISAKMKSASETNIPALAEGGIVTGPTLALIGEGRESEAVIPLSKLDNMMGSNSGAVTVYGKISGQDILLSSEKASRTRSRYRGF